MKKLITYSVLLFTCLVNAQDLPDNLLNPAESDKTVVTNEAASENSLLALTEPNEDFADAAEESGIAFRTFSNLPEIYDGYYAIIAVLSKTKNLKKTVKKLNKQGFASGFINNPDSGLNYIYLNHYSNWQDIISEIRTDFDGRYEDDVWVMEVVNGVPLINPNFKEEVINEEITTINEEDIAIAQKEELVTQKEEVLEQNSSFDRDRPISVFNNVNDIKQEDSAVENNSSLELDAVTYDMLNDVKTLDEPNVAESSNKSKLVQKADSYFNKMWYAEAAEIYEQALRKGGKNNTDDIIQKAAESHYFNTNMEKAYEWYNKLYEDQGNNLSAQNTFRYSHALKGTGKYASAKKQMRLYNRKISNGEGEIVSGNETQNELVLDGILAANPDYEVKNLAINSEYSDFSPMFLDSTQIIFASAKDSSFLKTRKYKWNDQPYLDLYTATINEETQDLNGAGKLSKKVNTKYHEASTSFSPDQKTMYFTRNNYGKKLKRDKNGVNNLKIYVSKLVGGEWSEAEEVPFNSDDYSTGHPALSPDGKKLYFVSDMPGSIGKTDIFVVDVLEGGQFSDPKNLGPEINTESREMFPFINSDKLFFSSDGHVSLGGLDVFEVPYTEDEGFGEVKNVGKPINSNKDDFSYIVDDENTNGYFASNRTGGKGDDDIYSFKRPVENLNAITGIVKEIETDSLLPQANVQLLDEEGNLIKEVTTGEDGTFLFDQLDSNTKYTLRSTKGEFLESTVDLSSKDNELVNQDLEMKRIEDMIVESTEEGNGEDGEGEIIKKIKTEMIFFDFDKSYIRDDASVELNKLVEVMREYPNMVIKIESHTDSRGSAEYNKYLSDKRAKSTREYIISQGIDASRIQSAIGYGEELLINECDGSVRCTEEQHFRNRRSEFIIVDM
ncbi:OmpA family protein [bacterium]|nr:OmpA family protein [bacterium]